MNIVDESRWRPLGCGHAAPMGSIINTALAARLAAYKRNVAGRYQSVAPSDVQIKIPSGVHVVSPKIDGEQWFLYADGNGGGAVLLSPTGRAITGIPLTDEAAEHLIGNHVLVAGELYANGTPDRPRVHDVASALGGGAQADVNRLRFAPFDLLQDGVEDAGRLPFAGRVERLRNLLGGSDRVRPVNFEQADGAEAVADRFDEWVTRGGEEGIVVRCADGRIVKIKTEINIDAVVVGFSESGGGRIGRLLLALIRPDGEYQLIGSVGTGFTEDMRATLHRVLSNKLVSASYRKATREGALYRFVKPRLVVELKCNDLLTHRSDGLPVRRMALDFSQDNAWAPLRNVPAVSMINAVFVRVREDKQADPVAVRLSQVTDLVPVEESDAAVSAAILSASEIIRRDVYTKVSGERTLVRKLVIWKTNKETSNPAYPPYAAFFTDFSPGRKQPLKTDIRVATTLEKIEAHVEQWLVGNIKRGWECVERKEFQPAENTAEYRHSAERPAPSHFKSLWSKQDAFSPVVRGNDKEPSSAPTRAKTGGTGAKRDAVSRAGGLSACDTQAGAWSDMKIGISFSRSSSANFTIALRRAKALAAEGAFDIENDDKGRQSRFNLTLDSGIVENAVRIENLVRLVSSWRGTELSIGGEPVSRFEFDTLLEELGNLRLCWLRQKKRNEKDGKERACCNNSPLGCRRLRIEPNQDFLRFLNYSDMPWFAVGSFDGRVVTIGKVALRAQIDSIRNERLSLCPLFGRAVVLRRIDKLPDVLDPKKDKRWVTVHSRKTGKPVWVLPGKITLLPYNLTTKDRPETAGRRPEEKHPDSSLKATVPSRKIPPVRYYDICGQDAAVEAVRDYVELPVKHAALFERIGVKAGTGILLYGPPGNGKTLLAKAVAGETGAHIEIVSGPEILSMWLGESESALRSVFQRARKHAPSVILFDEIDSIAPAREAADAVHQKVLVSQLLVLLDGLEERGRVFVIAATNRPKDIDPALKRPGRFDRLVYIGPPDEAGRAAIFKKYLSGMKTSAAVSPEALAAATPGFSGAQIEHAYREAGLLCIKDVIRTGAPPDSVEVLPRHFHEAIRSIRKQATVEQYPQAAAASVFSCRN